MSLSGLHFLSLLYSQIVALNEAESGSVRGVFRPWSQRLDLSLPTLDSNDDDPELLIHVPFNGCVKIKVPHWL
jgi:hypothetical protein